MHDNVHHDICIDKLLIMPLNVLSLIHFLRSGEGRIVVIIADDTFNINIIYNYTFV